MSSEPPASTDSSSDVPFRTQPIGRTGSRVFVIGLFLLIAGLGVGQSYYLISVAESAAEMPARDTTETVTPASDSIAAEPGPSTLSPAPSP